MLLSHLITLAVLQGLTEFLPVSSSAHLILVPRLLGWPDQGLAFDVAVHLGTLTAVVLYFRTELARMSVEWLASVRGRGTGPEGRLAWYVLLGTIPVGLAGLLLKDWVETALRSPLVIAWATIGFGVLLGLADWQGRRVRSEHSLGVFGVLFIGVAQALALIPGTSRSGATMTAALALGLTREAAARFSFLLSIPVIVLAGALEIKGLIASPDPVHWPTLIGGAVVSAISAFVCIHFFLKWIARLSMWPFVIYRFALGGVLLILFGVL
ncbi:undecaprenyl-diphosphate phosphatase [Acidihalobacter ferrooxydans]|uniref:Undecaprenyl-diphosphatase n=1 Tax=Acidihalobacter ferrooxydans TaxID=1765967 RepID=A0A1P8UEU3_9GAMM|nr:undecaprenyl-diphosphate phosphatase [Acidihalobacter ferrooxydans]APZ42373.1 undecaprenyl-diphosphatase [Acidihalobacter ferrooxydans]